MRACWCTLAGTEYCKNCNNSYERSDFVGVLEKQDYSYTISTPQKSVKQHLKEVEELIEQNKELQKRYPDHAKGLQIGLKSLEELKKEMLDAL